MFAVRAASPVRIDEAFEGLRVLASEHKDGWGVCRFDGGRPQCASSVTSAAECTRFLEQARPTTGSLIAHIRLASVGTISPHNTHPFQHGPWAFMHNGTLHRFAEVRDRFDAEIAPEHRARLRGETDSERCFALFLTYLEGRTGLPDVARALAQTFRTAAAVCDVPGEKRSAMNFLVSDGQRIIATRRDRSLYVARSPQAAFIASERLLAHADWQEVGQDELVWIDEALSVRRTPLAAWA